MIELILILIMLFIGLTACKQWLKWLNKYYDLKDAVKALNEYNQILKANNDYLRQKINEYRNK